MTEFFKVFDAVGGVTVQQALAFAALVVPGFIALRVYELRRGGEARKVGDMLFDVFVYSVASDAFGFGALAVVSTHVPPALRGATTIIVAGFAFLVAPALLAWAWFDIRTRMTGAGTLRDGLKTELDRLFDVARRERHDVGLVVTMRDGRMIGARLRAGREGARSLSDAQIWLSEVWTLDEDGATFIEAVAGSFGIVFDRADCTTIEFIRWRDVQRASSRPGRGRVGP